MPINIDDNDFPASYDSTLNLVQVTKSLAHLIKKITGKNAWTDYPEKNIQELKVSIDNINSINRSRILWKTAQTQNYNFGTSATTLFNITIPAGTCSVDSILKLHLDVFGANTANTRNFFIVCNGVNLSQFTLAQNTWYPIRKLIAFNGTLSTPFTSTLAAGGFASATGSMISSFANFAQEQTISIRASASVSNEALFLGGGWLELI